MVSTILRGFTTHSQSTVGVPKKVPLASSRPSLDAAERWDAERPVTVAKEMIDGKVIVDVVARQRGGPMDIYFVVTDREAGYLAAAPIIRRVLQASSLALDFHFLEPDELLEEN